MIILIGGEKGGTGKSTIATNLATWLAHQGQDVLLLDADRQSTAANWAAERGEHPNLPPVHCVQRYGNLFKPIQDLRTRYAEIVVDAGGRDSEELRSAMSIADKLYSPARASQSDLWTLDHLAKLVALAQAFNRDLTAHVVVSIAPTNPRIHETDDAAELLGQFDELVLSRSVIHERKVYRDAMREGRGVMEMETAKATGEIEALAKEIYHGKALHKKARRKAASAAR
jgi:chromosome partitioning protein